MLKLSLSLCVTLNKSLRLSERLSPLGSDGDKLIRDDVRGHIAPPVRAQDTGAS